MPKNSSRKNSGHTNILAYENKSNIIQSNAIMNMNNVIQAYGVANVPP